MKLNYSVDMLRLRVEITSKMLEELILKPFEVEPGISYRFMTSIKAYRHNFVIEDYDMWGEKCSFWIGCCHNSRKHSEFVDVVLEYNPNKCEGKNIFRR